MAEQISAARCISVECVGMGSRALEKQGRGTRSGASSGLSKGNVLRERFHSFITAAGGGGGGKKKRKIDGEVKRD